MFNGILTMQKIPSHLLFDPNRPSQSIADLLDFMAQKYLQKEISSIVYVKPAVAYIKESIKLIKSHDFVLELNKPEFRDEVTDAFNLEVLFSINF